MSDDHVDTDAAPKKILGAYGIDRALADRELYAEIASLADSQLIALLAVMHKGPTQALEAARSAVRMELERRRGAEQTRQARALVDATRSFREAVKALGVASQNLTAKIAAEEKRERRWDRRTTFSAAIVAAIVAVAVNVSTCALAQLQ